MKYIVLGAGEVGSVTATDLGAAPETTSVCVADVDRAAAERVAQSIGAKGEARQIDIYDHLALVDALQNFDLVVNTVGPFYKTADAVLPACMAAKVNYIDIADDSAAVQKLLTFEKAVKDSGITAVISHGVSPGVTNVLARSGIDKLDKTQKIQTLWCESSIGAPIGPANIWHALEMCSGTKPQVMDGELAELPAVEGDEVVEFLEPLGEYPVYYCGHGEPVSLHRYFPEIPTITNKGNSWPQAFDFKLLKFFDEIGLADMESLEIEGQEFVARNVGAHVVLNMLGKSIPKIAAELENVEDPGFQVRVDVEGEKNGASARYSYLMKGDMAQATGLSLSYGAQSIASGSISGPGLFAPEVCQDPARMCEWLKTKGFPVVEERHIRSNV